ncbi:MAG: hypothetical protein ACOH5I_06635 [Oligoflexus sp.]
MAGNYKHKVLISIHCLLLLQCRPPVDETTSKPHWHVGAGPTRGHEDLTRMAVSAANDHLQSILGYAPYPKVSLSTDGIRTDNQLVKGNYETDFPSTKMRDFYSIPQDADWHHNENIQHIHSMRNKQNGHFLSNRESCELVRQAIKDSTEHAFFLFDQGRREEGLYWLGHVTHIIQDSFSPAHTERLGPGRTDIQNFCTYGSKLPNVCFHKAVDLRDRVWKKTWKCSFDPNNRGSSCLRPEAKDAVAATASYLKLVGEAIFDKRNLDQALAVFFDDQSMSDRGYFHCVNL